MRIVLALVVASLLTSSASGDELGFAHDRYARAYRAHQETLATLIKCLDERKPDCNRERLDAYSAMQGVQAAIQALVDSIRQTKE